MRSSITKRNARYRGPTMIDDYVNTFGEIFHDLALLQKRSDMQTNNIKNDLYYIVDGQSHPSSEVKTESMQLAECRNILHAAEQTINILENEVLQWAQ